MIQVLKNVGFDCDIKKYTSKSTSKHIIAQQTFVRLGIIILCFTKIYNSKVIRPLFCLWTSSS